MKTPGHTAFGSHPLAGRFNALTPQLVADAIEVGDARATGRFTILNSYENRVYQLELDDDSQVVGKFYRPGRWSLEAIQDEHDFLFDLDDADVPVALPLELTEGDEDTLGDTIGTLDDGIHYALFERVRGRSPHELDDDQLVQMGRLLAQLHDVGDSDEATHRPELNGDTYGRANLAFLLDNDVLPASVRDQYAHTVEAVLDRVEPWFRDVPIHRIHGDCHLGNLIWTPDGPVFVDFDDMVTGPAVQDVWMLVPSYDAEGDAARKLLLEGYTEVRDFSPTWLRLVEPLRALRFVHYATWIARRFDDPTFKRTFEHFGTERYWQQEVQDLREQIARIDAAGEAAQRY